MPQSIIGMSVDDLKKSGYKVEPFNPIGMHMDEVRAKGATVSSAAEKTSDHTAHGATGDWTPVPRAIEGIQLLQNSVKNAASSIYHAATDKRQVGEPSLPWMPTVAKRLFYDPQKAEADKAHALYAQPGFANKIEGFGHAVAAATPMVGPLVAGLTEKATTGHAKEAAADLITMLLMGKAAGEVPGLVRNVKAGVAEVPGLARAAANRITTPENLMLRAATNRTPLPPANMRAMSGDLAATAAGYAAKGVTGSAVAEGANLVRKSGPYRTMKAGAQEGVARWMAKDQAAPVMQDAAPMVPNRQVPFTMPDERYVPAPERPMVPNRQVPFTMPDEQYVPTPDRPMIPNREIPFAMPEDRYVPAPDAPMVPRRSVPMTPELAAQIEQERIANLHDSAPQDFVQRAPVGPPREIPGPVFPEESGALSKPDFHRIERAIAPSGRFAKQASQMVNADGTTTKFGERLIQEVPELADARTPEHGRAALTAGIDRSLQRVIQAEDAVPREVVVEKQPIVDQLQELADEYEQVGNPKTSTAIKKILDTWKEMPSQIPWEQFRDAKRAFFKEANTRSAPMRRAYGSLMEAASKVSPELSEANGSYATVRRALDNAGIDIRTGRRIINVGKADKSSFLDEATTRPPSVSAAPATAEDYLKKNSPSVSVTGPHPAAPQAPVTPAQRQMYDFTRKRAAAAKGRPTLSREETVATIARMQRVAADSAIKPQLDTESSGLRGDFNPKKMSLAEFVRKKGGMKDFQGDLRGREYQRGNSRQDNLRGSIMNNKSGMDVDYMREAAAEAGYPVGDGSPNDFMAAIDADMRGNRVYSAHDEGIPLDQSLIADVRDSRGTKMSPKRVADALKKGSGKDFLEIKAWFDQKASPELRKQFSDAAASQGVRLKARNWSALRGQIPF